MTDSFDDLLAGNAAYAEGHTLAAPTGVAARGLAIVTCIDSRLDPLRVFGLVPGDAKILRNAGARVTDDVERSLAVAAAVLGVSRVAVVAHTNCKMASVTDAEAAEAVAAASGADPSLVDAIEWGTVGDQREVLKSDLARLSASPLFGSSVTFAGFVLDLDTGLLAPL